MSPQPEQLRIIAIGAHPDDCEYRFAGSAAKFVANGHAVKFVSMTNGDAGHQSQASEALAYRRKAETVEAARRLGIQEYEVFHHHDGQLQSTLEVRHDVIRCIREWQADLVLTHRPNDYHPDHRYTSVVVQDAAYLVVVPKVSPETSALKVNPVFLYLEDEFQKPLPFSPDVVVAIDDVWDKKIDSFDAHVSQFYEWLPWVDGILDQVPGDPKGRKDWLKKTRTQPMTSAARAALERRYGAAAAGIQHVEAFELCEYGSQPSLAQLDAWFPR